MAAPDYVDGMMRLRSIFHVFMLALIFAVGTNGVVMASNDVMHQKNCVHTSMDGIPSIHDHGGHDDAQDHESPAHDHETCMMHACSAITLDALGTGEVPITFSAVLTASERELTPLGLTDNFLRPPNT